MADVDVLIVGAGPTGLFGAYYAGFRGLSVAVMDALPEVGGQVSAMYPEKHLHDVAGFPSVRGRDLVAGLVEQAAPYDPVYRLGETAAQCAFDPDAGVATVTTEGGDALTCGAVILTSGIGRFTPRPLPAAAEWAGEGVSFFITDFGEYVDRDVVIVGGGDSAFDWALHLHGVARSVTLVHRRETFRAHRGTVDTVLDLDVDVRRRSQVTRLLGGRDLQEVEITHLDTREVATVKAQRVVAALGFRADLGPLTGWGLRMRDRYIEVDTSMATSLPRVYAAGDISDYPGKVRLIAVGFGEVATAVNNAAVALDPEASLFPGHSTEAG